VIRDPAAALARVSARIASLEEEPVITRIENNSEGRDGPKINLRDPSHDARLRYALSFSLAESLALARPSIPLRLIEPRYQRDERVYSARRTAGNRGLAIGYLLIRKRRLFMRITARIMQMAQDRAGRDRTAIARGIVPK